jgi:hypothetical protein
VRTAVIDIGSDRRHFRLALDATTGVALFQIANCRTFTNAASMLPKWLLMCHDRLDGVPVPLTQEVLARVLGTRRACVTVAAGKPAKGWADYIQSWTLHSKK